MESFGKVNPMRGLLSACLALLLCLPFASLGQQGSVPATGAALSESAPAAANTDPVLTHRPPPRPANRATPEGRIQLDVLVTDAAGTPVSGLEPLDFKLLDDNQPRKILSIRSFDGVAVKAGPPVEVILLLDMMNLPFQQVAFVRGEIEQFLREHGGHLAQPVSIIVLTDAGLRVQPRPSVDGNALLGIVEQIKGSVSFINPAMGGEGEAMRFQRSVHQLATIAENEANKPGRKLLVWVGPGWPMLDSANVTFSEKEQRRYFDAIVELSTKLREARMVVYSVSATGAGLGATPDRRFIYQDFLKGVRSPRQAEAANLALKVLATQTGGRILGPDNDLAGQIDRCIADANTYYRISFDPPRADHADEYHDLKVIVGKPGLTARTNTGYYNQP